MKLTLAECCHYHHATHAYKQQSERVGLQYGRVFGGSSQTSKQRQKMRAAKGERPAQESIEAKDEIIVQRMSSEVTGKQQKFTRIGPREFVPSEFNEITFDDIVEACHKYFLSESIKIWFATF